MAAVDYYSFFARHRPRFRFPEPAKFYEDFFRQPSTPVGRKGREIKPKSKKKKKKRSMAKKSTVTTAKQKRSDNNYGRGLQPGRDLPRLLSPYYQRASSCNIWWFFFLFRNFAHISREGTFLTLKLHVFISSKKNSNLYIYIFFFFSFSRFLSFAKG